MRRALILLVLGGCLLRSAGDSPTTGQVISDYRLVEFAGGSLHVRLVEQREIAEWITNEYAAPFTIDVTRTIENLEPEGTLASTVVIPAHATVRLALWDTECGDARWHEQSTFVAEPGDPAARPAPYAYALPFAAGDEHRIIQGFHGTFSHTGDSEFAVDFEMPEGTLVRAARDGIVVAFHDGETGHGLTPEWRAMAKSNWLLVLHDDGTLGAYWHLAPRGVLVAVGARVARGDAIARSGSTGYARGPHLHFEVQSATSGAHARSFPFVFQVAPGVEAAPIAGTAYRAFE